MKPGDIESAHKHGNDIVLERHSGPKVAVNPFSGSSPFQVAPVPVSTSSPTDKVDVDEDSSTPGLNCMPDDHQGFRAGQVDDERKQTRASSLVDVASKMNPHQQQKQPAQPPSSLIQQPHHQQQIDNTTLTYLPIKLRCGATIKCQPNVLVHCRDVLADLSDDISLCLAAVPPSIRPLLLRTTIWVNLHYSYGPISQPRQVKHTTTHHHSGWLVAVANDRPEKVHSIELFSATEYRQNRLHYNGAGLLLHEYCHLIHQLVLPNGLENDRIKRMYVQMRQSGLYECVLRRDWAGLDVETDLHYCIVNYKEMWAELSVAFLCDGYACVRSIETNNRNASRVKVSDYSPPFMSPAVLERLSIKSKSTQTQDDGLMSRIKRLLGHRETILPCSKFYPFTREQFQAHDSYLYSEMAHLWQMIADWEGGGDLYEYNDEQKCWGFSKPPPCLLGANINKNAWG